MKQITLRSDTHDINYIISGYDNILGIMSVVKTATSPFLPAYCSKSTPLTLLSVVFQFRPPCHQQWHSPPHLHPARYDMKYLSLTARVSVFEYFAGAACHCQTLSKTTVRIAYSSGTRDAGQMETWRGFVQAKKYLPYHKLFLCKVHSMLHTKCLAQWARNSEKANEKLYNLYDRGWKYTATGSIEKWYDNQELFVGELVGCINYRISSHWRRKLIKYSFFNFR